jgi:CBS domain containing-hemolysin-like protein
MLIYPLKNLLSREKKGSLEEDSNRSILNKILSFMNKHHPQNGTDLTEEINDLIDEGQAKGFITDEESEMVHGVLELKETTALSIMIPRTDLISAPIDTTLGELINLITTCGHTRIPIYGENIDEIIVYTPCQGSVETVRQPS